MNPESPLEHRLDDWFEAGPTDAPDQLLDTILAAVPSIPQRRAAWRIPWRTSPMLGFARAIAAIAITLGLAAAALFFLVLRPAPSPTVGGHASPSASVEASPTPSNATTAPSPATTPATTPAPTVAPTIGPCDPAHLAARITLWEGAAGSRIAHVELTNASAGPCIVRALAKPQLVDGSGSVLIDGAAPAGSSGALTVKAGGLLTTLVQDSNYCGPAPVAPVSVAFVLSDGGRIVATPFSPTDATVPPCLGAGSPADITMQPWAP